MGDLTTSSHEWWSKLVEEAKGWYLNHQKLGPLESKTPFCKTAELELLTR